jgi:phosphoribosylformylglycinamidine cyclo-ligase
MSYLRPISALLDKVPVRGMAHITGGGFVDNIPRVLPERCTAVIDRSLWNVPALFKFIAEKGKVDRDEMYRVFNMGIGYVVMVRSGDAATALELLQKNRCKAMLIGWIDKGLKGVELIG